MADKQGETRWLRYSSENWSQARAGGRRRFALINGAMIWGGLMSLGLVGGRIIFKSEFDPLMIGFVVFFAAGGYWIGLKSFEEHEKEFLEFGRVNPPAATPEDTSESN
ncbi:MAG: hypothetical protein JSS02_19940 [Planctomycetes bacterium]|nr:hypothetical protein [Planctomycetota bacterium]